MPTPTSKIRPPIVDDFGDRNKRETRTAIQQLVSTPTYGRLLGRKILSGSGIYTPTPSTVFTHLFAIGGGGGGGGANGSTAISVGGGGATGTLIDVFIGSTSGTIVGGPYSLGAGGAGGASGLTGSIGGDTTITINGITYIAKGGGGGTGQTGNTGGFLMSLGGDPISGSSTAGLFSARRGGEGFVINNTFWFSGAGAGIEGFGTGGTPRGGSNAGTPGTGFGAGGSGASAQSTTAAGGAGSAGTIVIYEYA